MQRPRGFRIPAALFLLLVASQAADAEEKVVRRAKLFDLVVDDETGIKGKILREIEKEAASALDVGLKLLGVSPKVVFYTGVPTPVWMGKPGKLVIAILPYVPDRNQGLAYWSTQLFAGGYRIEMPPPEGEVTSSFRRRLWREVGVAILGNTLFKTNVRWWSRGVLDYLAARGAEAPEDRKTAIGCRRATGSISRKDVAERMKAVLAYGSLSSFEVNYGPALGFAAIELLANGRPEVLHHLQRQLQTMAYHLEVIPKGDALEKDFTLIASHALDRLSLTPEVLAGLVSDWIQEGHPIGGELRRSKLGRALRRIEIPLPYEVAMSGRWSRSHFDDDRRRYHTFEGGAVTWRLPRLKAEYHFWAGIHRKLPRDRSFSPARLDDGLGVTIEKWDLTPEGRRKFNPLDVYYGGPSFKYEFTLLWVTSENRVRYRFYRYWKSR